MSNLFHLIDFKNLKEGTPVLSFGVYVLRWNFASWGDPAYAFVDAEDTEAELTALRARIAELEAEARWIPVGERLPEPDKIVLALWHHGGIDCDTVSESLMDRGHGWREKEMGGLNIYMTFWEVTHWRPLPAPPEEKEEG